MEYETELSQFTLVIIAVSAEELTFLYVLSHFDFIYFFTLTSLIQEPSGSVVECLTRDRGAACSSLTGVTVLCPLARTFILA